MAPASIAPRALDPDAFPYGGSFHDQALSLIGYATLAPSGHNTQPWRFAIGDGTIALYADRRRALPVVDPDDRELVISCGAALAMLEVAAKRFGFVTDVSTAARTAEPDFLAEVALETATAPHQLPSAAFEAIAKRRTARVAFLPEPPPAELVASCQALAHGYGIGMPVFSTAEDRKVIAALVGEGDKIQFDDPAFRRELAYWVHSARGQSKDGMSGASFGMPDALSAVGRLVIRTFDLGGGIAAADEKKITNSTPLLGLLCSVNDDTDSWLATGRALTSVLLELTAHGFSASYLNQPIETESLRGMLAKVANVSGHPQILLRIGKAATDTAPTVRRDVAEVIC